jgi:cytochrome c553
MRRNDMNCTAQDRLPSPIRSLGILALGALTAAGCVSTENGTTYSGPNIGKVITIDGYHTAPNTHVAIQVLNNPASNPADNANWTTVATTFSSSTVSLVWANTTDLYEWSVDAVLVPNAAVAARWPAGGLVKVRAKLDNSIIISPTLDDTQCMLDQHALATPFLDALAICESHDSGVLSLVDIDNVPNPNTDFLSRKKTLIAQTAEYYKAVGALTAGGAPSASRGTFNAWKNTNGFPAGEIVATYYNRGDLGFGRDMHCRTTGYGKACYVTNYGTVEDGLDDLADGTALNDAIAHANPGATVAMEWHQAAAADQNPVRFFVYSAGGGLLDEVSLDSNPTAQPVPGLCMACHGGTFVDPANALPRVQGAQFLPFDVDSFAYHPSLSKADQMDEFEDLNLLVKATVPVGSTTRELIDGWHAAPGVFDGDFVPAGWEGSKESEAFYEYVYRPYCQMCHTSQANAPKTFANFSAFGDFITTVTCGTPATISMPHAEVTYENFWKSSARAHLTAALNLRNACDGN